MNNIAAKAVAFQEALKPSFKKYGQQILKNAKILEQEFVKRGGIIVFGKTENHMIVLDVVKSYNLGGKEAEQRLDAIGITVNKNVIPDDPRGPMDPSGIRIGVPALTTRGMKEAQVKKIVGYMHEALAGTTSTAKLRREVTALCKQYPLKKVF
jgi:glycine hydroxymethyltransferase